MACYKDDANKFEKFFRKICTRKLRSHFILSYLFWLMLLKGWSLFVVRIYIIHRNLSSNSVLLTKHLVAKIADLGVAKVIQENRMKTHTGSWYNAFYVP